MPPHLSRITIYPVKSLEGVDLTEAHILPGGALENDRRFAMFDSEGHILNGKRTPLVHRIRSCYDAGARVLTLGYRDRGETSSFHLDGDRDALNLWLSNAFEQPVSLREAPETGFPDDTEAPGPTVIATATLETVASWYEGIDLESGRGRFRANLEIGGVEPFWDDRLYAGAGEAVRFRVGAVVFEGVNPCQRCIVPWRAALTGELTRDFMPRFRTLRKQTLPPWANASRFNHFYRLAVNTRKPDRDAATIRVGDSIEIEPFTFLNQSDRSGVSYSE